MKKWKVVYTQRAENDLRSIYEYIALTLSEPVVATKLTRRIMVAAEGLEDMPMRHPTYQKEPWCSRGLRFVPIDKYLLFYVPIESQSTVTVVRIMYGGRDIENQLSHTANTD